MDSIKKKVMEFKDDHNMQPAYSMLASPSTPLITTDKNTMVGFDEQLLQLLDKLTGQQSNRQIIPIVGMGGIGKTTLAQNAYEHSLIVHHFDIRTWVTVSQKYNVKQLLLQLLSENNSQMDEQLLGQKLHKMLWGRRYLIVTDDIWSIEAWEEVCRFFPDNNNGSRIVVTTRISNVATHFDSLLFELSFLDEDQSWDLFCKKTFGEVGCPLELEDIGKEIVQKCKGLPLSISVIGGLLGRSHKTQEYWKIISKDLISNLNLEKDENCSSILSLSYTYLPPHLKPCFLYVGIFPEDHEILVSQLIKLWVAEGFIKPNKAQSLEDIARGYLNDLVDRNLILKHKLGSNGRIKFCKIHDLLRDLSLKAAQKDEFMCMMEDIPQGIERERRIVCNRKEALHTLQLASLTRTLVTSIHGRLSNNRLLRVMLFNNIGKRNFLRWHSVDQVNTRYLAYNELTYFRSFFLVKLPSSIDVLWNLQTIIIKREIKAPSEIWEMRQLRHVDIWGLNPPDPPQNGDQNHDEIVLQNLQTLKSVRNFVWSEEACKRVVNLRKLNIVYGRHSKRSNDYSLHNICKYLHKLESLKCSSYGLDNVLQKLTFPSSLKKLYLVRSKADWKDLTVIDSSHFPVLEKLFLKRMDILDEIPLDIGEIPTLGLIHVCWCSESAAISAMKIAEEQENACNEGLQVRVVIDEKEKLESFREKMKQSEDDDISFTRNNFHVGRF
ncbi:PREDICTED: putative late blight resistance protein homolog R1A-10 [Erythranthe guttata]|uniref:putative late blight resistance protein homolog R1A-10 n=1 Tax=Erythranthe guttata TaxID=4155 RepID=UPI00064DFE9A|nr:PREDICTED: putative late blight resistance protein homolog R1A-10 [Erythranthe guttata]|eukprot:XP_012856920.1 PREDICTED: putative late blight resistance protein homolog R1A-10 [Erythranthe guttata]